MEIKNISTKDLLAELVTRPGVQKISVGLYKEYGLIKKYCNPPERNIEADTVLIINYLDEK